MSQATRHGEVKVPEKAHLDNRPNTPEKIDNIAKRKDEVEAEPPAHRTARKVSPSDQNQDG